MVQLFYYDTAAEGKCKKLMACYVGCPIKVSLHQEEDCTGTGLSTHWLVKFPWFAAAPWLCRVSEYAGGRKRRSGWARVRHSTGDGRVVVSGRFNSSSKQPQQPRSPAPAAAAAADVERDFYLSLTSRISEADFQQGYSMTGWLEMGHRRPGLGRVTHAAVVRRQGY